MRTFRMTRDRLHLLVPLVLTPVLIAQGTFVPAALRASGTADLAVWLVSAAMGMLGVGLAVTTMLAPRAATLTPQELRIERWCWPAFRVPRANITRVERGPEAKMMGGGVRRVAGVGGWFWSGGLFSAQGVGRVRAWLTRMGPTVVIHRSAGLPMLLTVDDLDGFLAALR